MSINPRLSRLARLAALSLALTLPAAAGAVAHAVDFAPGQNTAFGSAQEDQVLRAAQAPHGAALSATQQETLTGVFKLGQNDAFGSASAAHLPAVGSLARIASAVPMVGAPEALDVAGPSDTLAASLYHPGSGTDW